MTKKLTNKQKLFVKEYLVDLNATQAAIRAKYSAKTAKSQGQRLLTNVDILTELKKQIQKQEERTEITADWILESLVEVAKRCMQKIPIMIKEDGEWIESGEWKFDSSGANKALELLGKHKKLFTDVIEHHGKKIKINVSIPDDLKDDE